MSRTHKNGVGVRDGRKKKRAMAKSVLKTTVGEILTGHMYMFFREKNLINFEI